MNWFERYGIPGTYFYIALLSGLYALYPSKMETVDMRALAAFAASFLPVGYIISVFGLLFYLRLKFLGLHRRAAKLCGMVLDGKSCESIAEPELEVLSCLNVAKESKEKLDAYKFIQEWIRKRMDVIAINHSIQIATYLVLIMTPTLGFAIWGGDRQPKYWLIRLLALIFVFIIVITILTNRILMKQIANIINRHWKKLGFENASFTSPVLSETKAKANTDSSTEVKS